MRFFNHLKQEYTEDAVHETYGRWWIKVGFAGFNSRTNNIDGYATRGAAERAILSYQVR